MIKKISHLTYVSDEKLYEIVNKHIGECFEQIEDVGSSFHNNVIDPFTAYITANIFKYDHRNWIMAEEFRQSEKKISNHTGHMHQDILCSVKGWDDSTESTQVDILSTVNKTMAEIKNKHNTVSGGKLAGEYYKLQQLTQPIHSRWHGYKAYFVNIITKRKGRVDHPWTPSDPSIHARCPVDENIRYIDGASFYSLVTGENDALLNLYKVLPIFLEKVLKEKFNDKKFSCVSFNEFQEYFDMAFE